jgi:hypothetical protein
MSNTRTPVRVGVFDKVEQADSAVHELHLAGFQKDQISLICPTCEPQRPTDHPQEYEQHKPAGAQTPGAVAGGGALGALLGGAVAVASVGVTGGLSLVIVGPLFAGAAGGAVAGGLLGAMMTRGFEKETADYYDQAVQKGKILVAVEHQGPDQAQRLAVAERIFLDSGAEPINLTVG